MQPCIERGGGMYVCTSRPGYMYMYISTSTSQSFAEAQLSQCSSASTITTVLLSPEQRLMAAPSQSLRSKLALDQLIKAYMDADGAEQAKMDQFEAGYFRDVVACSPASSADLVSVAGFEQLLAWVSSSMDVVRPELLALAYHLFVKSYVRLIQKLKYDEAKEFWRTFCPNFWAEHGEQMREVAQLTSADQLQEETFVRDHPFISSAAQEKVLLELSSTTFKLLKTFLIDSELNSVLSILNAEFIVQTEKRRGASFPRNTSVPWNGSSDQRKAVTPLSWRVPGKPPKSYKRGRTWGSDVDGQTQNRRVGGTILQQAGETEMEGLPDCSKGFFCELLERVVLPKVLQSEDVGDSMIGEVARRTVDLAPCDKKIKGTADNDDNQSDAASLLPSVMFATFANTYGEMACLHLTQDSTLAVAGFTSSSSVLVWDWDRVRRNGPRNKAFEPCQFRHVYPHVKGDSLAASPVINEEVFTAPVDSTTGDKGITVSKIKDGSPLALIGHSERVHSVSVEEFTGDHRLVLSAAADETVRLWDLDRARCCRCPTSSGCVCESSCLARYSCTDGIPWSVEFGPFGYHFLVGNQGGTSTLYSTDRLSVLRVFRGHTSDVTCSSFHPNAAYVATGSDDGSVRLWDIRDATQGSIRQMNLTQSSTGAAVTSLKCSPCGSLLAVGYYDGTAAVWDVPTGRLAYLLQDDPGDLENGAVSSSDRPMRNRLTQKQIYALQFDHATSRLATGGQDCAVKLWDLNVASGQRDTYSHCLLKPRISFHTKFTPVYAMSGFQSLKDTGAVLVAGGPSSIARITP